MGANGVAPQSLPTRAESSTSRRGRLALGILVVYAACLGIALLVAAPIDLRVQLPLLSVPTLVLAIIAAALASRPRRAPAPT